MVPDVPDIRRSGDGPAENDGMPSNAELKQLIREVFVRLENWKLEAERNPNPRAVHSLKNLVTIIDTVSRVNEERIVASYKDLSIRMASLTHDVASLNLSILNSLKEDDRIDEDEGEVIVKSLMKVIHASADLIKTVQKGFGMRKRIPVDLPPRPPSDSRSEEHSQE